MLLIRNADIVEVTGRTPAAPLLRDVRIEGGRIAEIGSGLSGQGAREIDGAGGALVPGLHDHHLHLYALAAADRSVVCGPPAVASLAELASAIQRSARETSGGAWVRGVAYHESVAGELGRRELDAILPDRPLRIQHRSGMLWMVNTAGAEILELELHRGLEGVELDSDGRPNGRLVRLDGWIGERTRGEVPPDVNGISRRLAEYGVTGVTDASHDNSTVTAARFRELQATGDLLQHVRLLGDASLAEPAGAPPRRTEVAARLECGQRKILLDEHALPGAERLRGEIAAAHDAGRGVAIHCVTLAALVFALDVLDSAGSVPADRIEHASETNEDVLRLLARAGVTVVTQPNFVRERGDGYLRDLPPDRHAWLYRGASFGRAGIPFAAGTDAPYGDPNPWRAMTAACDRRTREGSLLGQEEGVTPERALALFCGSPHAPGGRPRTVSLGVPADLCLLEQPWGIVRDRLDEARVRVTIRGGRVTHER